MIAMAEVRAVVAGQEHGEHHDAPPLPPPSAEEDAAARGPGRRLAGAFASGEALVAAARDARRLGLAVAGAHAPHPVHGLDAALGLRRSRLPWVTLAGGAFGLLLALVLQYWTSASDWPLDVGGKPLDSLPAFMPVAFELLVLCAGLSTAAALLWRSRLRPGGAEPVAPPRATDDRFVLVLRPLGARTAEAEVQALWRRHGALDTWTEHAP
jgi:hypothetical protein